MNDADLQLDSDRGLTDEFVELVVRHLEGGLTAPQADRLNRFLTDDADCRDTFVALCTQASLMASSVGIDADDLDSDALSLDAGGAPPAFPVLGHLGATWRGATEFLSTHEFFTSYLVATVLFGIAALLGLNIYVKHYSGHSGPGQGIAESNHSPVPNAVKRNPEPEIKSIARITGMVDCRWVDTDYAPIHDRVVLGAKFMLKSGLMEITYYTGAKVILQGPCTYEVESADGGFLSLGKLTARVEKKSGRVGEGERGRGEGKQQTSPRPSDGRGARGEGSVESPDHSALTLALSGHHEVVVARGPDSPPLPLSPSPPLFAVHTPTAVVTDLGTEFGVDVEKSGATHSRVFRGRVEVRVVGEKGNAEERTITLGENESARVTIDKTKAVKVIRAKDVQSANMFVRDMPKYVPIKLFNTGIGLKEGDNDPHWQFFARNDDPKFKPRPAVVAHALVDIYSPNDPARSQWVSTNAGELIDMPGNATYTFRTTFDMAGLWLQGAGLRVRFRADNFVGAIRINGRNVPLPPQSQNMPFDALYGIVITNGIVQGTNTLEIDVNNYITEHPNSQSNKSAIALRVELEGTALSK